MNEDVRTHQILDSGSMEDKIIVLESLSQSSDQETVNKIISKLDDSEIEVRGEAFSSLFLNKNDISKFLIDALSSENNNIKGFSALVLANRGNSNAISILELLTKDSSGMVRSCALGALGHLRAKKASKEIHNCIFDTNIEVKKSAAYATILIGEKFSEEEKKELKKYDDSDFEKILRY